MMNTNPNISQALYPLLKAILSIPSYFWGWIMDVDEAQIEVQQISLER